MSKTELLEVAYWRNDHRKDLPMPVEGSANPAQVSHQLEVLDKFAAHKDTVVHSYRGISMCRICGKMNGSREFENQTLGAKIPQGARHYVEDHQVLIPHLI